VTDVESGGPADKAGIRREDIITSANGKEISDMRSLQMMTASQTPGTKCDLNIVRNGSNQKISVILGTMPADPQRASNDQNPFPGRGRRR